MYLFCVCVYTGAYIFVCVYNVYTHTAYKLYRLYMCMYVVGVCVEMTGLTCAH